MSDQARKGNNHNYAGTQNQGAGITVNYRLAHYKWIG